MRTAILSDVHSNVEALTAVLEDARRRHVDEVVCLGDCVGYGAEPGPCIAILREACAVIVAGNHDQAAAGTLDASRFSTLARRSAEYTHDLLTTEEREFLAGLPLEAEHDGLLLVHASPVAPGHFPYIKDLAGAAKAFHGRQFRAAVYGHTHLPMSFHEHQDGSVTVSLHPSTSLGGEGSFLVNVGSVGQPRDCDPRACYAIHDSSAASLVVRRVEYDIEKTQRKIDASGLPETLGRRLLAGV